MISLFLLAGFILMVHQLAMSQQIFWATARRILLRLTVTCAVVFALMIGLWRFSTQRQMVIHDGHVANAVLETSLPAGTFLQQTAADDDTVTLSSGIDLDAVPATNNTMVLVISGDDIQQLLGEDAASAFVGLQGLNRAYAMIPLPATGSSAMPAALLDALNPTTLRNLLSPDAMQVLATALSKVVTPQLADDSELAMAEGSLAESEDLESEQPAHVLASWISNPGVGQVVVKSEFLEATTDEVDALRESIVAALKERVGRAAAQQFGADANWEKLIDVSLTDQALRSCILSTDARTQVIETREGSHPMQQTYALVEFPEAMQLHVLAQIKTALQQNRLVALCVSVAVLWLAVILFSAACRFSQSGSLLRKLATFPVMALLILPCMLVFAFMVGAMIKGATFEFQSEDSRAACIVDHH